MPYDKAIICLANSRKPPSGRCIAGRELGPGEWIRPVSTRPTQEISEEERRYEGGHSPKLLDVIDISFLRAVPSHHQKENHLIDDSIYWQKVRRADWGEVQACVESPRGPLWVNGHSSYHGSNDRVPESLLDAQPGSLYLIKPEDLRLAVARETSSFSPPRRRVRAKFDFNGTYYHLVVTDPWTETQMLAKPDGDYRLDDALLCVSLGEVFQGNAYKLAAAVITPDRAG